MDTIWWAQPSKLQDTSSPQISQIRGIYDLSYGTSNSHTLSTISPQDLEAFPFVHVLAKLSYDGMLCIEKKLVDESRILLHTSISFYFNTSSTVDPQSHKEVILWMDEGGRINAIKFTDDEQAFTFSDDVDMVMKLARLGENLVLSKPNVVTRKMIFDLLETIQKIEDEATPTTSKLDLICVQLLEHDYLKQIVELYQQDNSKDMKFHYCLRRLIRKIFLFNERIIFRRMFEDDIGFTVIKCLQEYQEALLVSLDLDQNRLLQRRFWNTYARFCPITCFPDSLTRKVKMEYKISFCLENCVPDFLKSPTTLVELSKNLRKDIITFVIEPTSNVIGLIVKELTSNHTPESRKRDLLSFLKELYIMCHNYDNGQIHRWLERVVQSDIIQALENTLGLDNEELQLSSVDVLRKFSQLSGGFIFLKKHCLKMSKAQEPCLIQVLIQQIGNSSNTSKIRQELSDFLIHLLDSDDFIIVESSLLDQSLSHSCSSLITQFFSDLIAPFFRVSKDSLDNICMYSDSVEISLHLLTSLIKLTKLADAVITCILKNKELLGFIMNLLKSVNKVIVMDVLDLLKAIICSGYLIFKQSIFLEANWFEPILNHLHSGRCDAVHSKILDILLQIIKFQLNDLVSGLFEKYCLDSLMNINVKCDLKRRYEEICRKKREKEPKEKEENRVGKEKERKRLKSELKDSRAASSESKCPRMAHNRCLNSKNI